MTFITEEELGFIRMALEVCGRHDLASQIGYEARTVDMGEGAMGSFRIGSKSSERRFGGEVAHVQFFDSDGVWVDATVNIDTDGRLWEVDLCKMDESRTQRLPRVPSEFKVI